jgi:hypothetical protein
VGRPDFKSKRPIKQPPSGQGNAPANTRRFKMPKTEVYARSVAHIAIAITVAANPASNRRPFKPPSVLLT